MKIIKLIQFITITCISSFGTAAITLTDLGDMRVTGMSADGSTVIGDSNRRAVRWTQGAGIEFLYSNLSYSDARSVSTDGNRIVGGEYDGNISTGMVWDKSTALTSAVTITNSFIGAVSSNGSTIAGTQFQSGVQSAFRATINSNGISVQNIGSLDSSQSRFVWVSGLSADGQVLVGQADTADGYRRAIRWTPTGGMQNLGNLNGAYESQASWANATNASGSIVVGVGKAGGSERAMVWTEQDGMRNLGAFGGFYGSEATALTLDGSLIVGFGSRVDKDGMVAMAWTSNLEMIDLNTYLTFQNIDMSGWVLNFAQAVSADGSVIAGTGTYLGEQRGFLISGLNIPSPASGCLIIIASLKTSRRRSQSRRPS